MDNAFDCVGHGFLLSILKKMGLNETFIRWINLCISSPWISPLMNGTVARLLVFQNLFLIELIESSSNLVSYRRDVWSLFMMRDFTSVILFTDLRPLQFEDIIFINHFFGFHAPLPRPVLFPFFPPPPLFLAFYS